jgi:hypothetical protein
VRKDSGPRLGRAGLSLAGALVVGLLWGGIPRVRADVSTAPTWRLADGITAAIAVDDRVYVGGTFSELFSPATSEDQFYDLVSGQVRPECARSTNPQRSLSGYPDGSGGLLVRVQDDDAFADGLGPYVPAAGSTLVRITDQCVWDRQFEAEAIDPSDPDNLTVGVPARVGGVVLQSNAVLGPNFALISQVASFSATTGRRAGFQTYDGKSEIGILGASSTRVIVRVRSGPLDPYVLGALNPTTLQLTESSVQLSDETSATRSWIRGDTLYRLRQPPFSVLEAYDLTTLSPKSGWTPPFVPGLVDLDVAGNRVFITSTSVNGQTAPAPAALVASSGALDTSWTPPALTRRVPDPSGTPYRPTLTALSTDGTRLYVSGDFQLVAGADRDGVAALTLSGASLDTWDPKPAVVAPLEVTSLALLATRPAGSNRTERRFLAAIDRATGAPTAWNPNDPSIMLQHTPSPVASLAADATHVYFASATTGDIWRADRVTAEVDQTWRLTLRRSFGTPGVASTMSLAGGVLYIGGEFDSVSGTNLPQAPRRALAAVGVEGQVRTWAPVLDGFAGTTFLRAMLVEGSTVYIGGDFFSVNDQFRPGYAALDATTGDLSQPAMVVQGETSVYGIATDGTQMFVAGVSFGAPLVGSVGLLDGQLTPYGPVSGQAPPSATYVSGRLYAGQEFDVDAGAPTARRTKWGRVVADARGLIHVLDDGTIEYYSALPGTPPDPPTLSATSIGNTAIVSWTPASSGGAPSSYTLYAGSAPGSTNLATLRIRGATSYTTEAPKGLYYLTVVARNVYGASASSNEVPLQVGCVAAPPPPGPLSYTTAGSTVALHWGTAHTATSYRIEAGASPGLANLGVIPVGGTTFSTGAPLGTYYVRVRAVNECGVSGPTTDATVVIDGTTLVPTTPTALAATVTGRDVRLGWNPPMVGGSPSSYVLDAGVTPGGVVASIGTTVPSVFVPNAPPGTYYVRVRAVNAAGASAPTADVTVVVP